MTATGAVQLARRYGFRDKPQRVRFRWLDPGRAFFSGGDPADVTLDMENFMRLVPIVERVFITALYDDLRENRIAHHLRLEQERIGFGRVQAELARITQGR